MPGLDRLPDFLNRVRDCIVSVAAAGNAGGFDVFSVPADGSRSGLILQRVNLTSGGNYYLNNGLVLAFGRVPTQSAGLYNPAATGFNLYPPPGGGILLDCPNPATGIGSFTPMFLNRHNAPIQETIFIRNFDVSAAWLYFLEFRGEGSTVGPIPPSSLAMTKGQ